MRLSDSGVKPDPKGERHERDHRYWLGSVDRSVRGAAPAAASAAGRDGRAGSAGLCVGGREQADRPSLPPAEARQPGGVRLFGLPWKGGFSHELLSRLDNLDTERRLARLHLA